MKGLGKTLRTESELLQSSWRRFFWASFLDQLQCSVQMWLWGITTAPLLWEQLVHWKVRGRSLCTWGKWRWVMRGEAQSGDSFPCYEWAVESGHSFGAFLPHFCSSLSVESEGDLSPAAINSSSPSPKPPKMGLLCFLRENFSSSLVQSRAWAWKPSVPPTAPPVKVGLFPSSNPLQRVGLVLWRDIGTGSRFTWIHCQGKKCQFSATKARSKHFYKSRNLRKERYATSLSTSFFPLIEGLALEISDAFCEMSISDKLLPAHPETPSPAQPFSFIFEREYVWFTALPKSPEQLLSLPSLASLFIIISILAEPEKESIAVNYQAIAQSRGVKLAAKKGKWNRNNQNNHLEWLAQLLRELAPIAIPKACFSAL